MTNRQIDFLLTMKDLATQTWTKFNDSVQAGVSKLQGTFSGVKGLIEGAFAIGALRSFIDAGIEAEQATTKVDAALRAVGETAPNVSKEMLEFAEAGQRVTTFSHEQIQAAEAMLISMTGLTGRAVMPLTKAVLDMAIGLNINAESAAKMVAKTEEGQNALKRAGIDIGETANESDRLALIISEIEKRWGGMAEAMGSTNAGKLIQAKNAIKDIEEEIGQKFLPVLTALAPAVQVIASLVLFAIDTIKHFFINVYTYIAQVGAMIENIGNKLGLWKSTYFESLAEAGKKLSEQYGKEAVDAWNAFTGALNKTNTSTNTFNTTITKVIADAPKAAEAIKQYFKTVTSLSGGPSEDLGQPKLVDPKKFTADMAEMAKQYDYYMSHLENAAHAATETIYQFFQGNVQGIKGLFKGLVDDIIAEFERMVAEMVGKKIFSFILDLIPGGSILSGIMDSVPSGIGGGIGDTGGTFASVHNPGVGIIGGSDLSPAGAGGGSTIVINALDAKSFNDYLSKPANRLVMMRQISDAARKGFVGA